MKTEKPLNQNIIATVMLSHTTRAFDQPYTYLVPYGMQDLQPGMRVIVPFGRANKPTEAWVASVERIVAGENGSEGSVLNGNGGENGTELGGGNIEKTSRKQRNHTGAACQRPVRLKTILEQVDPSARFRMIC